jgi:hypothetical protein
MESYQAPPLPLPLDEPPEPEQKKGIHQPEYKAAMNP